MTYFRYEVADKKGRILSGTMQGQDAREIMLRLQERGYTVRGVGPAHAAPVREEAARRPATYVEQVKGKASEKDLYFFFSQLGSLLRAGVNPHESLDGIQARTRNGALRAAAAEMSQAAEQGVAISEVMRRHRAFPHHATAIIRAGEMSGQLPGSCDELAATFNDSMRYKRWFWFVKLISWQGLLAVFLVAPALPAFWATFQDAPTSSTGVVMGIGSHYLHGVLTVSLPLIVLVFGAYYGLMILLKTARGTLWKHRALLAIPGGIGARAASESQRVFLFVLRNLYSAGVAPKTAWETAAEAVPNAHYRAMLRKVGAEMSGEANIEHAASASGLFDQNEIAILQSGRQSGDMVGVLEHIRATYEQEFSHQDNRAKVFSWVRDTTVQRLLQSPV
jgi:type IV pilus assembly protein PilC